MTQISEKQQKREEEFDVHGPSIELKESKARPKGLRNVDQRWGWLPVEGA